MSARFPRNGEYPTGWWEVRQNGRLLGRVYFSSDMSRDEVRQALIANNFPSDAVVAPERILGENTMPRKRKGQDPEAAGEQYATDQIASTYFGDWVREQLLEASKLPADQVLPLETKDDATVIARNMLRQLETDTKRELRGEELKNLINPTGAGPGYLGVSPGEHADFFKGFRKACDGSRDWLADELLTIKGEMGVREASRTMRAKSDRYSLRQSPENALIYNAFYGTTHIGHVAGPYREGSSDYYQWKMNALAPSSEHQFGRRSLSGRGRTQTAAFNQLIQAHKSYGGVGEPPRPKARGSARRAPA